jgi:hypothetical protein
LSLSTEANTEVTLYQVGQKPAETLYGERRGATANLRSFCW